jgi:hypothetical protein
VLKNKNKNDKVTVSMSEFAIFLTKKSGAGEFAPIENLKKYIFRRMHLANL